MPTHCGCILTEEELLGLAANVLTRVLSSSGCPTTAWVSGSMVEGLGNPSSDIDIFVALPQIGPSLPTTRRNLDHSTYATVEGGRRFDVEYWSEEKIGDLANKLAEAPIADPMSNTLHYFEYWETEFIHRILVGLPLLNEEAFMRLRGCFNRRRLGAYLATNAIHRVDDAFDDTVGMLLGGDLDCAVLRARDTVEFSIDAMLYANGVTNDKTKFRPTKVKRLLEEQPDFRRHLSRLWHFQSLPVGMEERRAYVEDALRYSSELVEYVQLGMAGG
jgi:predicted nucleotidyltransferase